MNYSAQAPVVIDRLRRGHSAVHTCGHTLSRSFDTRRNPEPKRTAIAVGLASGRTPQVHRSHHGTECAAVPPAQLFVLFRACRSVSATMNPRAWASAPFGPAGRYSHTRTPSAAVNTRHHAVRAGAGVSTVSDDLQTRRPTAGAPAARSHHRPRPRRATCK
jgi:hypothetical protein